jgi:hypothetical protein
MRGHHTLSRKNSTGRINRLFGVLSGISTLVLWAITAPTKAKFPAGRGDAVTINTTYIGNRRALLRYIREVSLVIGFCWVGVECDSKVRVVGYLPQSIL